MTQNRMASRWEESEAQKCNGNLLDLRVYTSRLLGADVDLVMHGGGNTSVKIKERNIFGKEEDILYVKGSGWDLGTIEAPGFAPVKLASLLELANLDSLSDLDMVKYQRMAMTNPSAPNPSVEAILHAIIPFTFVDHTHADAVVTITNTPNGLERIKDLYGEKVLIVPYVMPGFILAKEIYRMTQGIDWSQLEGMILMNHGVFTFDHDPKQSYEKMIDIVAKAEQYLEDQGANLIEGVESSAAADPLLIAQTRKAVSEIWGRPILANLDKSPAVQAFASLPNVKEIVSRGPLTPDHIIRTKRLPLIYNGNIEEDLEKFTSDYRAYFDQHNKGEQLLDQAPRSAILPGVGSLSFGPSPKHLRIIRDIAQHTQKAIYQAEQLGGWQALGQDDLFEMEYWSLEQAKLKKAGKPKEMQGKVALVTGAASGIGQACVESLLARGACVCAIDINPEIESCFPQEAVLSLKIDVTNDALLKEAIEATIYQFGGLDMIISNVGIFPPSAHIQNMESQVWEKSLAINVSSHQRLIQLAIPYLELGFSPSVLIIGSKNVAAPGPGASAYSVSKAALTQLGRVAAMELGGKGIRVNILHPNAVFDTGIWSEEVLAARAKHYGLSVQEYKTNNILRTEVTSKDVAEMAAVLLSTVFAKTTGAQIPIDGGNDRVI